MVSRRDEGGTPRPGRGGKRGGAVRALSAWPSTCSGTAPCRSPHLGVQRAGSGFPQQLGAPGRSPRRGKAEDAPRPGAALRLLLRGAVFFRLEQLRTLSQAQGQLVCQAGVRRRPGNPHRGKGRVGRPCCHSPGRLGVTAAGPSGHPCPARRLSPRTRTTGLPCLGPSWGCARTRMTDGAPTQGGDGVGASPGLTFPTAACWWKKASDVRCKWTGHQILICSHCVLNTELFIHFESAGSTKHVKIKENKLDSVTKNGSTIFIRRLI